MLPPIKIPFEDQIHEEMPIWIVNIRGKGGIHWSLVDPGRRPQNIRPISRTSDVIRTRNGCWAECRRFAWTARHGNVEMEHRSRRKREVDTGLARYTARVPSRIRSTTCTQRHRRRTLEMQHKKERNGASSPADREITSCYVPCKRYTPPPRSRNAKREAETAGGGAGDPRPIASV